MSGLGLPEHPLVVTDHPMASRNTEEVEAMAARAVDAIVKALVR